MSAESRNLSQKKIKRNNLFVFIGLIVLTFALDAIPFVNIPFRWLQTYFHEISHGLAAILGGGSIVSINLHFNDSGLCTTRGGIRFLTVFAGYFGSVLWGALIYTMVDHVSKKSRVMISGVILGLLAISTLFWVRDLETLCIIAMVAIPFIVTIKFQDYSFVRYFLQIIGLFVLLESVRSPLYLLHYTGHNDALSLAELTGVPKVVWIFIWVILGLVTVYFLWKAHLKRDPLLT